MPRPLELGMDSSTHQVGRQVEKRSGPIYELIVAHMSLVWCVAKVKRGLKCITRFSHIGPAHQSKPKAVVDVPRCRALGKFDTSLILQWALPL